MCLSFYVLVFITTRLAFRIRPAYPVFGLRFTVVLKIKKRFSTLNYYLKNSCLVINSLVLF